MSTREGWIVGAESYASLLLTVSYSWIEKHFDRQDNPLGTLTEKKARELGKINASIQGYTSDLHNVSINYCLLNEILTNSQITVAKRHMYSTLVLENYFTNLRSMLDFICNIIRLCLTEQQLKNYPNIDSLNKLVSFAKKDTNTGKLPIEIHNFLIKVSPVLNEIRTIRDLIIHKGKEIFISRKEDRRFYIKIPRNGNKNENMLPNILNSEDSEYELYSYLRRITKTVFRLTEDIGAIMLNDTIKNNKFIWTYYAVVNQCLSEFNSFLLNQDEKILATTKPKRNADFRA